MIKKVYFNSKISPENYIIFFKDVCAVLEVTLFGRAHELVGELVSGNYILVNETKSQSDPCWKKDNGNLFLFRVRSSYSYFEVYSRKI